MAEPFLARVQTRNTPAENLRLHLLRNRAHHDALAADAGLAARLRALRQWQSKRMHRTHADLLANKATGDALRFLIDQVYCGQDYSTRAADIEQAYPLMVRFLPRRVLQTAAVAMRLYVLTKELDRRLADCLFLQLDAADLHDDIVAQAYRLTGDYRQRAQQIELVRELGLTLTQYTRSNVFSTALRIATAPARVFGLGDLHQLLTDGFDAFRRGAASSTRADGIAHTSPAEPRAGGDSVVSTMARRELRALDRVHADAANPFAPDEHDGTGNGARQRTADASFA